MKAPRGLWRLLGPALVCWGCAAALVHLPGAARALALASGVSGGLVLVWLVLRGAAPRRPPVVSPTTSGALGIALVLFAALFALSARIDSVERARDDGALLEATSAHGAVDAVVVLAGYPRQTTGVDGADRGRVRARMRSVEGQTLPQSVSVLLWLPRLAPDDYAPGLGVRLRGTLTRAPPQSADAYEVDVREFEESRDASSKDALGEQVARLAAKLRVGLRSTAARISGAELVPGLAVGDTALVDDELDRLMLASSLTHLVAVSGSNCALVIAAAVWAASRLRCGRRLRVAVAAVALAGFVVLVGPDASVQRAGVMASVLLVSRFGGRQRQALPSLGFAILVLLLHDPWQSVQAGFALSVAATGGILLATSPFERWLRTRLRLPRPLALPLAVATVAQAFCAPLLLLLQPGLPVGGVLANLVAAPAAPLGTGLGLAALALLPLSAGLGAAAVWLAAWPARWIEAAGMLGTTLPFGRWYWPGGWIGALLLVSVGVLLTASWTVFAAGRARAAPGEPGGRDDVRLWSRRVLGPWRSVTRLPRRFRLGVSVLGGIAAAVFVSITVVVPITVRVGVPRDWIVVACDVGQGDALLLRDPLRPAAVMLVDTGDDPAKLLACLDLFGVGRIELLVLTHDDRDHVGAVGAILGRVEHVLVSPASAEYAQSRPLTDELVRAGVEFRVGSRGMRGGADVGLRWEFIGPRPAERYEDTNATSLVMWVEVGGVRMLMLADTGAEEQQWLMWEYPTLVADIVKVAHHGSRDQAEGLYERLGARIALISVGQNRYGHPNAGLLERLAASGVAVLRTDELGSVAVRVVAVGSSRLEPWAAGARSEIAAGSNVGASR